MSRFGIFQQSGQSGSFEETQFTIEDDIAADAAYDEVVELAQEAEMDAIVIDQAVAIDGELDGQSELISELVGSPSMITAGTVAVAQDALALAVVALGGSGKTGYEVTGEAAASSPVEAMEVTGEGVNSTMKKIYAGIKMAFQRIALTIKKLAAKVVVALNGTGKKAEKLAKSFKADTSAVAKESKVDGTKALKVLEASYAARKLSGSNVFGVSAGALVTNMRSMSKFISDVSNDLATLTTAVTTAKSAGDSGNPPTDTAALAAALTAGNFDSAKFKLLKALSGADTQGDAVYELDGGSAASDISDTKFDDAGISDVEGKVSFYPMYVKGADVYGVAFYVEKFEDSDKESIHSMASKLKYKAIHIPVITSDDLSTESEALAVMGKDKIITELNGLKSASKKLKTYSDARMKDIDKVMKDIDAAAKRASGFSILNRLSNREFNAIRMFIASTYVASIFAEVKNTRAKLAYLQVHISMYTEA